MDKPLMRDERQGPPAGLRTGGKNRRTTDGDQQVTDGMSPTERRYRQLQVQRQGSRPAPSEPTKHNHWDESSAQERRRQLERRRIELRYEISQWQGGLVGFLTFFVASRAELEYDAMQVQDLRRELAAVECELAALGVKPSKPWGRIIFGVFLVYCVLGLVWVGISNLISVLG